MAHALIVEDDGDAAQMVACLVADQGFSAATAASLHDARRQMALLAVGGGLMLMNTSVGSLAALYGSSFRLSALDGGSMGGLLAGSAALGVVGAALSVRRALRTAG